MREPTELEKERYTRIAEIAALGRQRYLDAGGIRAAARADETAIAI